MVCRWQGQAAALSLIPLQLEITKITCSPIHLKGTTEEGIVTEHHVLVLSHPREHTCLLLPLLNILGSTYMPDLCHFPGSYN